MSEQERKFTPVDPTLVREQLAEMDPAEFAGMQSLVSEETKRRTPSPAVPDTTSPEWDRWSQEQLRAGDAAKRAEREAKLKAEREAQADMGAR